MGFEFCESMRSSPLPMVPTIEALVEQYEFLGFCSHAVGVSVPLGNGCTSVGDWCTLSPDNMVVSSLRVKKSGFSDP